MNGAPDVTWGTRRLSDLGHPAKNANVWGTRPRPELSILHSETRIQISFESTVSTISG